jgi:nucleoside 2-deoxyribosyltransferase
VRNTIERALSAANFRAYIADQEIAEGILFCRICERIRESRAVFFEVTNFNPNVAFESGFAIGIGKHVFFLSKQEPFTDIKGIQRIQYKNLLDLDSKIKKALEKYENKSKALFKAKVRKIAAAVGISETDPRFNELLRELERFRSGL